jgi:hypothetical protein
MWETSKIEMELERRLKALGSNGEALHARYISARSFLTSEILPWIRTTEPDLSDHGPEHIADVLNRTYALVDINDLGDIELYILCQSILFHDVGNLFGRSKHNLAIAKIYDATFANLWIKRQEMQIVVAIGRTHSGLSMVDGSPDTLKDLKTSFYNGTNIRVQHLAAILRFADELAEGPQRTSSYLVENDLFAKASQIYHRYAKVTDIHIDRGGSRIAISYHIELHNFDFKTQEGVNKFTELMKCIYKRIRKLDTERRYCKHYCTALESYKRTSVSITFWNNSEQLDLAVPAIDLDDLVVPDSETRDLESLYASLNIESLVRQISIISEEADSNGLA